MGRALREAASRSHWSEWGSIRCPAVVVRAGNGTLSVENARAMTAMLAGARLVELAGAGHDVHLDRPRQWRRVVLEFLDSLDRDPV
jgi:pimeloyl-ACP methyl ester carboxylesterase